MSCKWCRQKICVCGTPAKSKPHPTKRWFREDPKPFFGRSKTRTVAQVVRACYK